MDDQAPAEPTQVTDPTPTNPEPAPAADSAPADNGVHEVPNALGEALPSEPEPQAPTAPEAYEPFVDADGKPYDAAMVEQFSNVARELNLSQENAQKVFGSVVPAAREYLQQDLVRQAKQWSEDSARDQEFGGDNFKANLGVAASAYNQFASNELKTLVAQSGLGNHPEFIRLFYRVGKALQQDKGVTGGTSAPATPSRRYPNSDMVVD